MKEEKKIDASEFKDWKNNKITQLLYKSYLEDKKKMEERLLNLSEKDTCSEKIYWMIRGNINAINHTLSYIELYDVVDFLSGDSNE